MSYLAEQKVVGALFMDASCIEKVHHILSADMFGDELLGRIFLEFQRGYDNHYNVDLALIEQKLRDVYPAQVLMKVVRECSDITETSAFISTYAVVVKNDYKAQKFEHIISKVKAQPDKVDQQIGMMIAELEALQETRTATAKTLSVIAKENKDKYFCDNEEEKLYTGIPGLDDIIGGLEGGDVIVIGARPGVGKSALVTQITSNLSRQKKRIGFYNLEMQEKQVYERFIVSESGIGLTRLRRAKQFLGDEKERFEKANEVLEKQENIVITTGSKKVSEIRTESRHMGYDAIIIDYLQLLRADEQYRGNRYAEVGNISKGIKALSMELNIPIIVLSQLNRVSEMKETKEPTMAELRECGDIEQDASIIILLWNTNPKDKSKKACKVDKNRQGRNGKILLNFRGDIMRFEEADGDSDSSDFVPVDDCPFAR